jgi:hypothetical protein
MSTYPSVDESRDRLHRAGWSVSEIATATRSIISGTNGENILEARGATQSEAWWRTCEQARGGGHAGVPPGTGGLTDATRRPPDDRVRLLHGPYKPPACASAAVPCVSIGTALSRSPAEPMPGSPGRAPCRWAGKRTLP